MNKLRFATIWLDGCSGCHMSMLDMDERLVELAASLEVVYSPVVDAKQFPEHVDLTLIEGAVSTEEDVHKVKLIRARTRLLVSMGDCAITGNVPSMRNPFTTDEILNRAFIENTTVQPQVPTVGVPRLLKRCRPVHEVVKVDLHIPGCPPSADTLYFALSEVVAGRIPDLAAATRFGA